MSVVIFHWPGVGFIASPAEAEAETEAGVAAAPAAGASSPAGFEQAPIPRARAAQPVARRVARVMMDLPDVMGQLGPARRGRQAVGGGSSPFLLDGGRAGDGGVAVAMKGQRGWRRRLAEPFL
jgi:hypothetical protein